MLIRKRIILSGMTAVVVAALAGCGKTNPPAFRLNMTYVVSKQIPSQQQDGIANMLGAMFGTPDEPYAMPETGLDQRKLSMAAGPVWSDEAGGKHGLYRRHCAHCHGISGDGHGPTAGILNPYPRDYRSGTFKFKSTFTSAEPTHEDLAKIVHDGIPGTAMPSFGLLPPDEQLALIEYVKYLSIRGQMETALENFVSENVDRDKPFEPDKDPKLSGQLVSELLPPIVKAWQDAKEQVIVPEEAAIPKDNRTPKEVAQSVDKGRELFYGTRANCVKCHGPTALGDGQQDNFDNWNKASDDFIAATRHKVEEIKSLKEDLAKATDEEQIKEKKKSLEDAKAELSERQSLLSTILPPRHAIPRNLREGIFRGGRRPLDIYWRVSAGIPGTPMSSAGPAAAGAQGTLKPEEIWQIVDYVQSLPFEPASQPLRKGPINSEPVSTGE